MRHILATTACLLAAPAEAGPWLRAKGEGFLAFGANIALTEDARRPVHYDPTLYLDYGISDRLSLGLEAYVANGSDERTATVFATLPVSRAPDAPVSASFGLGWRAIDARKNEDALLHFGVGGGRGLMGGWLTAESALVRSLGTATTEAKLDLTWGRELSDAVDGVLQLQTGRGTWGDAYAKLAPSLVWSATGSIQLEMGLVQALTGDGGTGVRLSTWWRF